MNGSMRVVFACVALAACAAEERAPVTPPPGGGPTTVGEAVERGPEQTALPRRPPTPEQDLAMRKGEADVPVRDVILARSPGRQELRFYRDEVDCVTAAETTPDDDLFVASVELETEPGSIVPEGPQPGRTWTYRVGDEPRMLPGSEGWVTITRVLDDRTVEGRVSALATVEDERFELQGPFVATVCDMQGF